MSKPRSRCMLALCGVRDIAPSTHLVEAPSREPWPGPRLPKPQRQLF